MRQFLLIIALLVFHTCILAQSSSVVKIKGYAPDYIGQTVQLLEIEDYLSMKESSVATTTVKNDSTFSLIFNREETQKVTIRIGNNNAFMYIEPDANYEIYFPLKDQHSVYRPAGNQVEITFYNLDSTDINYKILGFNRWLDNYLAINYKDHLNNPIEFMKNMDTFKEVAHKYYIQDTGKYIYDYVRFSIANVDNTQGAGNRNRYEKHDFYLKHQPVRYQNDAYMDYFKNFYKGTMQALPMEVNNRVYLGLLKSSPSLIMNALGKEYTLINVRIREMVMIQLLSELYYSPDYPQTNILMVLDSVKNHALFSNNKIIARNVTERLTEAANGASAPEFVVKLTNGNVKSLNDYKRKYLYIHCFDPTSEKNKIELPILKELYQKYQNEVAFLTVCKESTINEANQHILGELNWDIAVVPDNYETLWKKYKIATFPTYILIDPYSYIVQAPALGPQPNNVYQTIDKVFFDIKKSLAEEEK